jgi:hypothetical protein
MIIYLLESAFCLACCYTFYYVVLRKETFFQWNRAFLLFSALASLVIPALTIRWEAPQAIAAEPLVWPAHLPDWPMQTKTTIERELQSPILEGWSLELHTVIWCIYIIGVVGLCFRFIMRLISLRKMLHSNSANLASVPTSSVPVASFFGYVFWEKGHETATRQLILEHELVHVRQWHSIDVLLMETMLLFQWFNPLMYAFRRSLCAVHEYIADDYVVRHHSSRYAYATLLVEQQRAVRSDHSLVNTFHSLIKNRLIMLAKHPSRPFFQVKYLLAFPLLAVLMLLFSFRMVEKLPVASSIHAAMQVADEWAGQLGEVVVFSHKSTPVTTKKTPYIFYWGAIQCNIIHDTKTDEYWGEISTSKGEVLEALTREPRIYNGHNLEQYFSFVVGDLTIKSDYNDVSVYSSTRKDLESIVLNTSENSLLTLQKTALPNQKTATIRIFFDQNNPKWLPRNVSEINAQTQPSLAVAGLPFDIEWGNESARYDPDREFYTLKEFWDIIGSQPAGQLNDGITTFDVEFNNLVVFQPNGEALIRFRTNSDLNLAGIRQLLAEVRNEIYPGSRAVLYLSHRQSQNETEGFNLLREKSVAGNPTTVLTRIPILDAISFTLVIDQDPRLALRRSERKDYTFEWGNLAAKFPNQYAKRFKLGNEDVFADRTFEVTTTALSRREMLDLCQLQPRFSAQDQPVQINNFTMNYKELGAIWDKNGVDEAMIAKLQSELKAGDKLILNAFQAEGGIHLLQARIVVEVRSDDIKPALDASRYILHWGDFEVGIGRPGHPQAAMDTVIFPLQSAVELQTMVAQAAAIHFRDLPLKNFEVHVKSGDLSLKMTEKGLSKTNIERLKTHLAKGHSLQLSQFKGDGVSLFAPTLIWVPSEASNAYMSQQTNTMAPQNLSIAPNPAQEQIQLRWTQPVAAKTRISIRQADGKVVFLLDKDMTRGVVTETLGIKGLLQTGTYFVTIQTSHGKCTEKLLVEQ